MRATKGLRLKELKEKSVIFDNTPVGHHSSTPGIINLLPPSLPHCSMNRIFLKKRAMTRLRISERPGKDILYSPLF
jgi:hypothetical protein